MGYEVMYKKIRPEEVSEMLRLASLGVRPDKMVVRLKRSKSAINRHLRECGFPASESGKPVQMADGRFKHSRTGEIIDPFESMRSHSYDISGRPEQGKAVEVEVNGQKATLVRVPDKGPLETAHEEIKAEESGEPDIYSMLEHAIQENIRLKDQITGLEKVIGDLERENTQWVADIERLESDQAQQKKKSDGLAQVVERFRNQFGNVNVNVKEQKRL